MYSMQSYEDNEIWVHFLDHNCLSFNWRLWFLQVNSENANKQGGIMVAMCGYLDIMNFDRVSGSITFKYICFLTWYSSTSCIYDQYLLYASRVCYIYVERFFKNKTNEVFIATYTSPATHLLSVWTYSLKACMQTTECSPCDLCLCSKLIRNLFKLHANKPKTRTCNA